MVDHGALLEPESSHEDPGPWKAVDLEEDEGYPVLSDSLTCPSHGAFPATLGETSQRPSGDEVVASDPCKDWFSGMVAFRVKPEMKGLAIFT